MLDDLFRCDIKGYDGTKRFPQYRTLALETTTATRLCLVKLWKIVLLESIHICFFPVQHLLPSIVERSWKLICMLLESQKSMSFSNKTPRLQLWMHLSHCSSMLPNAGTTLPNAVPIQRGCKFLATECFQASCLASRRLEGAGR